MMNEDERHNRPPNRKLFIYYLTQEVDEAKLSAAFSAYGALESVKIPLKTDGTGEHKGFGFVTFAHLEAAVEARNQLQGYMLGTKAIRITFQAGS